MKTNMQSTSLEAYFNTVLPNLGERQRQVLNVFIVNQAMNLTNAEVAEDLAWGINRVTPRVYELRGRGKRNPLKANPPLVESERRLCRVTRHMAKAWALNPYWSPGGYKID